MPNARLYLIGEPKGMPKDSIRASIALSPMHLINYSEIN